MRDTFAFNEFKPTYSDFQRCSDVFSTLDDLAPSDSHISAIVNKLSDGTYHTIIDIQSLCGKFYSEAKNFSLISSIKQAQQSMLDSLDEWKTKRFED